MHSAQHQAKSGSSPGYLVSMQMFLFGLSHQALAQFALLRMPAEDEEVRKQTSRRQKSRREKIDLAWSRKGLRTHIIASNEERRHSEEA